MREEQMPAQRLAMCQVYEVLRLKWVLMTSKHSGHRAGRCLRGSWDKGAAKRCPCGGYVSERLKPHTRREGLLLKNGVQSRGQNRPRDSRPPGIVGGLAESWTMVELGTRGPTERVPIGNSPPTVARAAFLSRQPHAAFDEAGAGNVSYGGTRNPLYNRKGTDRKLPTCRCARLLSTLPGAAVGGAIRLSTVMVRDQKLSGRF